MWPTEVGEKEEYEEIEEFGAGVRATLTFGSSIFAWAYESKMSRSLVYQKSSPLPQAVGSSTLPRGKRATSGPQNGLHDHDHAGQVVPQARGCDGRWVAKWGPL